jgi:DNA-binding transcriptional LysR family regulator
MTPILGGDADALDRGEIDFTIGPASYLSSGHPSERLFEDEFICLAWSGNREVGSALSLATYLRLGHVVVRFGKQRDLPTFDEWFTRHLGHERKIEVVTTAFNLVPQLLIGTSRIATVHRRLANFYQRHLPLRIISPPLDIPTFEEFMQWHRSRDRDPGTIWLRSVLKAAAAESPLNDAVPAAKRIGLVRRTAASSRPGPRTPALSKR